MEYKKPCLACGAIYTKPVHCSVVVWETRKFCSFSCSGRFTNNLGKVNKGKFGENSNVWKGDRIQVDSLHNWVSREWGKPTKCDLCGTTESRKFEWSNKDHTYRRNREDWQRVCKKCHLAYDIEHNNYQHHIPKRYAKSY